MKRASLFLLAFLIVFLVSSFLVGVRIPSVKASPDSATWQVEASADDAREDQWGTSTTDSKCRILSDSGSGWKHSGMRWDNVTIPQGATISSSQYEGYILSGQPDDMNGVIYGNDVDDANDFSTENDIDGRDRTTASVSWVVDDLGSEWVIKTGLTTIIQEIVNRGSWASGNAMALLFIANTDVTKECRFQSYDSDSAQASKLNVTWTTEEGEEENFFGEVNPQFTITHLNSWTFSRYGTVNPTFTIASLTLASVIKNFFGEVTQILFEFSFPAHQITWSFNRFGQIAQTWLIEHSKSWSFDLHGFINPLFTVESVSEFIAGAIENFYGEIITQFTITTVKSLSFTLNPIVDLLVSVNGVFTVPNLINIYAFINLAFTILGYSPIAAPITIEDVYALAAIAFILAVVVCALVVTKRD